jgi:8-oxo-dGTP pyrophosphatase MutT (NUDIX family)
MENIILDLKNYREDGCVFRRTAARGVVESEGKYLVIYSRYGDYKFPGGGREVDETLEDTLIREVREETGYLVIRESIKEYIKVQEKRKGEMDDILEMDSIYFLCDVETNIGERDLDEYEEEYDYQVEWLPLEESIRRNEAVEDYANIPWIVRENLVMKAILHNGKSS